MFVENMAAYVHKRRALTAAQRLTLAAIVDSLGLGCTRQRLGVNRATVHVALAGRGLNTDTHARIVAHIATHSPNEE